MGACLEQHDTVRVGKSCFRRQAPPQKLPIFCIDYEGHQKNEAERSRKYEGMNTAPYRSRARISRSKLDSNLQKRAKNFFCNCRPGTAKRKQGYL